MDDEIRPEGVLLLGPGQGRSYPCGTMRALFRADGEETGGRYSVSEWWLEPWSEGVHAHLHEDNEELFFVLKGRVTFHIAGEEVEAAEGSFLRIPAGVMHGFRNAGDARAGLLNVFIPGGFEDQMPAIVEWYADQQTG